VFDDAVAVQEPCRGDRSDPRNAWIAVRRVANEREEVGDQRGLHSELLTNSSRISDFLPLAIHLDYVVPADALRQVFVGRPEADFLDSLVSGGDLRRGCERIVGLQVGHGPYGHAHGGEGFLERVELRQQGGLNTISRLVLGPESVTEGLDDVVGRHTDVRGPLLDHLQDGVQHAAHRAEGRILARGGAAAAVELAEQLVGAVDEMNDHSPEPALANYHLLPTVRGDFLAKLGRFEEARAEFERAAALTRNARERTLLLERAARVRSGL